MSEQISLYDYVICKEQHSSKEINDFLSNNIGQVVDFNSYSYKYYFDERYKYIVKYNNIPEYLEEYFDRDLRGFMLEDIIYHSKNKEDIEKHNI